MWLLSTVDVDVFLPRHSYATHLIEEGYDPQFVQDHAWGSTTAI